MSEDELEVKSPIEEGIDSLIQAMWSPPCKDPTNMAASVRAADVHSLIDVVPPVYLLLTPKDPARVKYQPL